MSPARRELVVRTLGAIRAVVGLSTLVRPRLAGVVLGAGGAAGRDGGAVARMFGVRDVAIAAATLHPDPAVRETGLRLGLVCDAVDVVSVVLGRRGGVSSAGAVLVGGAAAAFALAGAVAVRPRRDVSAAPSPSRR